MSKWDTAKAVMKYTSPIAWLVAEGAELAAKSVEKASEQGVDQLNEEIIKQNLRMQFSQHQARIAQELAIGRRIDNAKEVEIEEFYDTFGKGNLGISVDQSKNTASIGLGAEGHQVTKRIYRFKGWRPQDEETITQIFEKE
jgi:hypothetical protein